MCTVVVIRLVDLQVSIHEEYVVGACIFAAKTWPNVPSYPSCTKTKKMAKWESEYIFCRPTARTFLNYISNG